MDVSTPILSPAKVAARRQHAPLHRGDTPSVRAQRLGVVVSVYASVRPPLLPLWFALAWYITVAIFYGTSPSIQPHWINSSLISAIVGTILNCNAYASLAEPPAILDWLRGNPFQVARFYLAPFCVSSYSSIVATGASGSFVLVFPSDPAVLGTGLGSGCGVVACAAALRWWLHRTKAELLEREGFASAVV